MSAFIGQQALAGNVFIGSTALAGVQLPVGSSTSAQLFGLWNPAGSGVNVVLDKLMVGVGTLGSSIVSSLCWMATLNAGSNIGTAAPIVAFNQVTPVNAKVGAGVASRTRFTNAATNTVIAAPTMLMTLAMAQSVAATGIPAAAQAYYFDHDGCLIIPQGVAIWLGATAAPVSAYQVTLTWAEVLV
jgi:hypothetical protein